MCLAPTITAKLLYFAWFGASSCLLPFLSLHMRELGIPVWETSIISGILPLLQLVTCSVTGTISRSSRSHKESTMWALLFTAISAIILLQAPEIPAPKKKNISMHFQCGPSTKPGILVDKCNYNCEDPTLWLTGLETFFSECHVDCPNKKGVFKNTADVCFDDRHNRVCHIVEVNNTLSENFTFGISLGKAKAIDNETCLYSVNGAIWHQVYFQRISCPIILQEKSVNCTLKCNLHEVPTESDVPKLGGMKHCLEGGPQAVSFAIWAYFGLRAMFQLAHGISSMMIDNGLINFLRGRNESHRKYTIWSYVASSVLTPLAGFAIDFRKTNNANSGSYNWIFFAFSVLAVITISLIGALEFDSYVMPPLKDTLLRIWKMHKNLKIVMLLCVVLCIGTISGFFDTFLFWHLEDLAAPYWVMGFSVSSGIFIGGSLSIKHVSSTFGRLGKINLLISCVTLQFLRCIGYYFANNFWWTLLFEFFGVMVFHILWKTVSMGRNELLPNESALAFQAYAGVLYYGIGKGSGSLIGGSFLKTHDFKFTFLAFGSFCGSLTIICFILYCIFLQRLAKNLAQKKSAMNIVSDLEDSNSAILIKASSALIPHDPSAKETTDISVEQNPETEKLNN